MDRRNDYPFREVATHPDDLHLDAVGRYPLQDHPLDEAAQESLALFVGEARFCLKGGQRLAEVREPFAQLRR